MKRLLFSARGMKLVNALFFLTLIIRHNGMSMVAYGAWIIYLRYCISETSSPITQKIYKGFVVFASAMILLNLFFYIKALVELF